MVQTRAQSGRTRAARSGDRSPNLMRDGPSALKRPSSRKKRIKKQKKDDTIFWLFEDLIKSPPKSSKAIKTAKMTTNKAEETAIGGPNKPVTTVNTSKMMTIEVQDTPFSGQTKSTSAIKTDAVATSKAQEPTTAPSLPKERIEQHTLSIRPQPGAGLKEVERTIRGIASPCGNVVWSSSRTRKPKGGGGGPATLEIKVIYNNCSRSKTIPRSCRRMRSSMHGDFSPYKTLRMEDVVGQVRGLTKLIAGCEVVARRSWFVNAVSHGGSPRAARN